MLIPLPIIIIHFTIAICILLYANEWYKILQPKHTGGFTPRYDPTFIVAPIAVALVWEVTITLLVIIFASEAILSCIGGNDAP
jgi:hypothetical protein